MARKSSPSPAHLSVGDRIGDALADVRALLAWVRNPNPSLSGNALRAVDAQMLAQAEEAMDRVDMLLAESAADENTRILAAVDTALAAVRTAVRDETDLEAAIEDARDDVEASL